MTTLKRGNKGAEVLVLQDALNKKGYGLTADSIYGPKTEAAVRDFQAESGLSVDGICGPKTWSKLGFSTADEVNPSRKIRKLIVHCSATPEGRDYTSAQISEWHRLQNFSWYTDPKTGKRMYVGYHYLIHPDGTIEPCRPESVRGCHVSGHNSDSIGICLIGGVDATGKPKDTRTLEQKAATVSLLRELKGRYKDAEVYGHRDFTTFKACPCFDARSEYKGISNLKI